MIITSNVNFIKFILHQRNIAKLYPLTYLASTFSKLYKLSNLLFFFCINALGFLIVKTCHIILVIY